MTKKKKNTPSTTIDNSNFEAFRAQLPEEIQNMMDVFKINSFDEILELSMLMGIDPDKVMAHAKEHGGQLPSQEDVAFDDNDPRGDAYRFLHNAHFGTPNDKEDYDDEEFNEDDYLALSDDEDDIFSLPQVKFISDQVVKEYHMRIKLNNSPVPIWREVKVPSNITMELFAFVIMDAMGWENEHLHLFRDKDILYKNRVQIAEETHMPFFINRNAPRSGEDYSIADVFTEKGKRIKFEYDFGDSWEHDVWLKGINEYMPDNQPGFYVVGGKGACPPEDCGGVWGYSDLLMLNKKQRKTSDEKERLAWYNIDRFYDENFFASEMASELLEDLWYYVNEENE